MKIINSINTILHKVNAQLVRYPDRDLKRRLTLLGYHKINKLFDVGANIGQYATELREVGFKSRIISFEPLTAIYNQLKNKADKDPMWDTLNIALGSNDEESYINVAGNSNNASSSLLEMLPEHLNGSPESMYVSKEKIIVRKLDSIMKEYYNKGDNIFLKIDVQGFEKQVLDGAEYSWTNITGIQIEMSLVPLYSGSILYTEIIELLKSKGFQLKGLENGFTNPKTGELLQVDGIFYR